MSVSVAKSSLEDHYSNYYGSARELEWFSLCADDKAANVIDSCAPVAHDSILDIGSGDGAVLHRLDDAGFGSKLHAIEISDTGLAALRTKSWKSLVDARKFDGYTIPYPDDSFDLAILSHVVEHVEHPRMLLYEAMRVARHIYIEVPLEYNRLNRRMRQTFKLDSTGHINFYDPTQIRLLAESCNLRVNSLKIRHFRPEAYTFHKGKRGLVNYAIKATLLRMSRRLATTMFNYHCSLLCTRAGAAGPAGTTATRNEGMPIVEFPKRNEETAVRSDRQSPSRR
jgi:SAM-dependent methyltransferase